MFQSTGKLRYSHVHDDGVWLVLDVDEQIALYYRSFMPKSYVYSVPRYPPHVSVVRRELPSNMDKWGKYDGHDVKFLYSEYIYIGKLYCWLDVFSPILENIREELGLPVHSWITMPPDGFKRNFHMTICNFKNNKEEKDFHNSI